MKKSLLIAVFLLITAVLFAEEYFECNGFQITAGSAPKKNGEFVIQDGTILLFGQQRKIAKLRLSAANTDNVGVNGIIEGNFQFDSGFGAPVTFISGKLTSVGITAELSVRIPQYNEDIIFSDVKILSDGSISGVSYAKLSFLYNDFTINFFKTKFDGKTITLIDGKVILPPKFRDGKVSIPDISAVGLVFNGTGILNTLPIPASNPINYTFNGWVVTFQEVHFADPGLIGHCQINYEQDMFRYIADFRNFVIRGNGKVIPGEATKVTTANTAASEFYNITLENADFANQGNGYKLICEKPCFIIAPEPNKLYKVYLGRMEIDSAGHITQQQQLNGNFSVVTSNHCTVEAKGSAILRDGIYLSGELKLPGWQSGITFNEPAIKLTPTGSIAVNAQNQTATYKTSGSSITAKGITVADNSIVIQENYVNFRGAKINLGTISFDRNGNLTKQITTQQNQNINLFNGNTILKSTTFSQKDGLVATISIKVPGVFSDADFEFNTIKILDENNFTVTTTLPRVTSRIGEATYTLNYVSLQPDTIDVEEAVVNLPGITSNSNQINCGLIHIYPDGTVERGETFSGTAAKLWGMPLAIDDFEITEDYFFFNGDISLPDSLPGALSELTLPVREFFVSHEDGSCTADISRSISRSTIEILDDWSISFSGVSLSGGSRGAYASLTGARLIFPEDYEIDPVPITDPVFDLAQDALLADSIQPKGSFSFDIGDKHFDFNKIAFLEDETVLLVGSTQSTTQFSNKPTDVKFYIYKDDAPRVQYYQRSRR